MSADVQDAIHHLYSSGVDVAVAALRANLREMLERVRRGEEIVVTERGTPVARLVPIDWIAALEQLERDGVLSPPEIDDRLEARRIERVRAKRPLGDIVVEQRGR